MIKKSRINDCVLMNANWITHGDRGKTCRQLAMSQFLQNSERCGKIHMQKFSGNRHLRRKPYFSILPPFYQC